MKRLILTMLLLITGSVHAESRWSFGAEALAWTGPTDFDATLDDGPWFGYRVNLNYNNNQRICEISHLSAGPAKGGYRALDVAVGIQRPRGSALVDMTLKGKICGVEEFAVIGLGAGIGVHSAGYTGIGVGASTTLIGYVPGFVGGDAELYVGQKSPSPDGRLAFRVGTRIDYFLPGLAVGGGLFESAVIFGGPFVGATFRF